MIDLLGGQGGLAEYKASLLASRGFAALALAYMTYEDIPRLPPTINMEYFKEAANWLSSHPEVLPHGIGINAISYGSWIALLMASFQMKVVKAVVATSPFVHAFVLPFEHRGKVSEMIDFANSKKIETEEGSIWRHVFPTVTDNNTPVSKYSSVTPVENISCPVLLVYGTDDLNANCDFSEKLIKDGLKKHGNESLCSVLRYPGAGHLIEPPYTPHCYAAYVKNVGDWSGDYHIVWGEEMNQHARAQEDAWPKILRFLRSNLLG